MNTAIQSFHTKMAYDDIPSTHFGQERISRNDNVLIMSPHYDLDLDDSKTIFLQSTLAHHNAKFGFNTAKQSFHKTLWLMMRYHQTKFGSTRIANSEDIIVETVIF